MFTFNLLYTSSNVEDISVGKQTNAVLILPHQVITEIKREKRAQNNFMTIEWFGRMRVESTLN